MDENTAGLILVSQIEFRFQKLSSTVFNAARTILYIDLMVVEHVSCASFWSQLLSHVTLHISGLINDVSR